MKWVITLTLLPVLSWVAQYLFSKKDQLLPSFRKHWTCYYADWIFIPINALFLYAVQLSNKIVILLGISLVINIMTHRFWGENNTNGSDHLFHKGTNKLNGSGMVHLVFSTIEMAILFGIFLLVPKEPIIFAALSLVLVFAILMLYGSAKIHLKIEKTDLIAGIVTIVAVAVKAILLISSPSL